MDHQSTGLLIHVASQQEIGHRQGDLGIFALPEPAEGGPVAGFSLVFRALRAAYSGSRRNYPVASATRKAWRYMLLTSARGTILDKVLKNYA